MTFTRRDLGRFALALPGVAALPRLAMAAPNSKFGGVQIGLITYSFRQGVPKAEIVPDTAKLGISEVELMSGDCEALAGMPQMEGGGRGPGGGGGRGRAAGEVAMAPDGCPVNTPAGQHSLAESGQAPARGGGGRGRAPMTPEQQQAQADFQKRVKDWRMASTPETWKGVKKQFNDAGINIEILCYNMGMNTPDEEVDYAFHMAQGLGVKAMSCSSTVAFAKRVAPYAEKYKMIWSGHGHADIYDPEQFAKPETFEMLIGINKYMGINLDIGHYVAAGYDPVSFIEKHHDRITNLHLKDRNKPDKCGVSGNLAFGKGDTPIKEVLLLMKKNKYKFPANIELEYQIPDGSDPVAEVGKCLDFCKGILTA
jgi:sugar phosphate isomerase/epimerase